jgi:hypothetical protein
VSRLTKDNELLRGQLAQMSASIQVGCLVRRVGHQHDAGIGMEEACGCLSHVHIPACSITTARACRDMLSLYSARQPCSSFSTHVATNTCVLAGDHGDACRQERSGQ